jgi:hypothetical protein
MRLLKITLSLIILHTGNLLSNDSVFSGGIPGRPMKVGLKAIETGTENVAIRPELSWGPTLYTQSRSVCHHTGR